VQITTVRRFGVRLIGAVQEGNSVAEYAFTLKVRGGLNEETLDALYEAGCGDVAFSDDDRGTVSADVVREAPSFLEAVLGAIRQIEAVPNLRVAALDGDVDADPAPLTPVVINAALTLRQGEAGLTAAERHALLELVTA
jgi:hypothetical protein